MPSIRTGYRAQPALADANGQRGDAGAYLEWAYSGFRPGPSPPIMIGPEVTDRLFQKESPMAEAWRRCSACKNDIALGAIHWVCSVSTCNRKRTSLVFCDVDCWEVHLPTERHREAWAVEARAPHTLEAQKAKADSSATPAPRKRKSAPGAPPGATIHGEVGEILVVASKLKAYVKAASGFNTSDRVLPRLSDALRKICDEAIENARRGEQQTVMDRDVPRES